MKFDVEHISDVKKKIRIHVPKETIEEKIDRAYGRLRKTAKIKGFRPGKAPRNILEKYYRDQVMEEVSKSLVQEGYTKVLEEGIVPVSYPHYGGEELREGEDFAFSLTVDVKPELDIKGYEGLEIKRRKVEVSDDEVRAELEKLRKSFAAYNPVEDRGIEMGDQVTIDFEGFVNGEPIEQGKAENATVDVGSNTFVPGFEEGLVGLKKGEEGEVKAKFPDDYHEKSLAGKEAVFKVRVKEIKRAELPELDDEFAKDVGDFSCIEELEARIASDIRDSKEQKERKRLENELMEKLLEINPFDVPESMLESQIHYRKGELRNRMTGFGMESEEIEKHLEEMNEEIRKQAELEVKGGLLLEAVAKKEGIEVTDGDLESFFGDMAAKTGRSVDELRSYYGDQIGHLRNSLMDKKVLDFLMDKAKIIEG